MRNQDKALDKAVDKAAGHAPLDLTEEDRAVSLSASLTHIQPRLHMAI
ncbi:hypothetical protein [Paraburkholderia bannensis]|nr:hypothetical protein [Paraburkholderia bannensis]